MRLLFLALLSCASLCFGCCRHIEPLISPEEIAKKIALVSDQIIDDFEWEPITLVIVMKGGLCLGADLLRQLPPDTKVEYLKATSYWGDERNELQISGLASLDVGGRHLLVVDDVFDSGVTLDGVVNALRAKNPASVKSLVLLEKKVAHLTDYRPDYTLFTVDDLFVVGYGLDLLERYRGLPGVYAIKE